MSVKWLARQQAACRVAAVGLVCASLAGCEGRLSALDPAGPAARAIAQVWHLMAWSAFAILIVMVALAVLACRRHPHLGERPPARLFLVGGGVLFPGVLLAALLVYGLSAGDGRSPIAGDAVYRVHVRAHQWWWEIAHPDAPGGPRYTVNEIHVPAGVPVHVSVTAADVIHGFWIPRLGGKIDALPGRTNTIRLSADQPGVYDGICAEFCGLEHTTMKLQLIAHLPADLPAALQGLASDPVRP